MSQRESSSSAVIWASSTGPIGYGLADLGAQVAGEDLGVAGLVHRLRGGVVLGVDPRHRLDDLGRRQHGALLAVHELAEAGLEQLDGQIWVNSLLGPDGDRRARARRPRPARAASPACRPRRAASGSTSVDQSSSVTLFHCEALALLYSGDELLALALVAPRVDARGVVVDQLDRRSRPRVASGRSTELMDGTVPRSVLRSRPERADPDGQDDQVPRPTRRARTMAWGRSVAWILANTLDTWLRTVFGLSTRRRAIVWLSRPSATSSRMSNSRSVSCGNGRAVDGPAGLGQLGDGAGQRRGRARRRRRRRCAGRARRARARRP